MKKALSMAVSAVIGVVSVAPAGASAVEVPHKFSASFIQGWYCRDWDSARWEQEFAAAKSAGLDSLILQSTFDYVREELSGNAEEPAAYKRTETYCMFPSAVEADYHSSQNGGDALELALKAAKANDMQLWLGTVSDPLWLVYRYEAPSTYFKDWISENSELCSGLVTELWERYGADYSEQIAGWYYNNEIWNIPCACDGSDNGEYARLIGGNIKATVTAIERNCPEKPLMLSPYYNTELSTAEQYGSFTAEIIDAAGLRVYDVYALQDGGSRPFASADILQEWAEAQKKAVDGRLRFWINNESFVWDRLYAERSAMSADRFREYYYATADLAEGNVIFSWNHYYADGEEMNKAFTEFNCGREIGDVNLDGQLTVADMVLLQRWLLGAPDAKLGDWKAADFCADGRLDTFDLCLMRSALIKAGEQLRTKIVSNVGELRDALKSANAGDVIKLRAGVYELTEGEVKLENEGTAEAPITLAALDPSDPPVLCGTTIEHNYMLHITGDWWVVDGLCLRNSQKGIVLDNSNHTVIQNCEIYKTGTEAVAVRDGSSYCTVRKCNIHDTGLVTAGYGEGVYIGSSKEKTEFDFKCDHNKVIDCTFKNVTAEHVDVKEYTTDTEICGCTFYGDGMSGENYAGSFLDLKGNDCYVHDNVGYRNKNPKIVAAFEVHEQVEGWGYHHFFENNTLYMDQPYGAENTSRRMYVVDGWFSDFSVRDNKVDYGEGLVPADSAEFYNSDHVTYLD